MRKAIFAGTFDPITKGHEDLVFRALSFFDEVVVTIAENPEKKTLFSIEQRLDFIRTVFDGDKRVSVASCNGLTGDFAKSLGAKFLLRGVRSISDFEYERSLAEINQTLFPDLETVMLFSSAPFSGISSSVVREVLRHKVDVSMWVSEKIVSRLRCVAGADINSDC
ncbi:MAG: pantetheine-phosphate adenylyltransferase [Bacteroidales bacterium]|jgi:pantetheine-phosphate adenylyltransferase|nr:pantetheine-phosphate adenylyltransferase [Bacteroidales bacterium]